MPSGANVHFPPDGDSRDSEVSPGSYTSGSGTFAQKVCGLGHADTQGEKHGGSDGQS